MKNIIFTLTLLAVMFAGTKIFAGGGDPHDSLLFDGGNTISPASKCPIMVKYISGIGEATIVHTKMVMICTEPDTEVTFEKGKVKVNDELNPGDEITTGPGSFMQIEFPDGSEIRMAPNSKINVNKNWCVEKGLTDYAGEIWINMKKLLGSKKYEVKTERCALGNRGTSYSVKTEFTADDTIVTLKVYDGSVEVMMNKLNYSATTDAAAQIQQVYADFEAKKITQEEYIAKIAELTAKMSSSDETTQKMNVTVTAGNMLVIGKRLGEPEPITGDDRWFETNFK